MVLEDSIKQKQDEIRQRNADLNCPEYSDKEWAQAEIDMLTNEIEIISNFLAGTGEMILAGCREGVICLIAHKGFLACTWRTKSCPFAYKIEALKDEPRQEALI